MYCLRKNHLLVSVFWLGFAASAHAAGVGKLIDLDANEGAPADPVFVKNGDFIQISVEVAFTSGIPETELLEGNALSKVGVIRGKERYLAYYATEKLGAATVAFKYKNSDGEEVVVLYRFDVASNLPGRLIEISRTDHSLTDVATGKPPVHGVLTGDLLRIDAGRLADVTDVRVTLQGDALKHVSTAAEGNTVYVFFSAAKVGESRFVVQIDETGFISRPIAISWR